MQGFTRYKFVAFLLILIATGNVLFSQEASDAKKNAPESNWDIDIVKKNSESKTSGIELVHAEEGTYLGAQKSKEGILIFQGGIIIKINKKVIRADTVKINPDTGEIYGEGGVTLTDELQTIQGSSFIYDNRIGAGVLYDTGGYYKPLYLIGDYSKITSKDNFIITASFLTSCTAESPHYYLKAKKVWLQKNNRFAALDVIFHVGKIPVFYLPFLVQTDFGTGIESRFGYSDIGGFLIQNSYYYGFQNNPILPEKALLMFDFYQYKGFYLGTLMKKKSPQLNYEIGLGIAFALQQDLVNGTVTNDILQPDGTVQNNTDVLYEINANINGKWKSSADKDSQSAIDVKFQQYNNASFNQLFKSRTIPEDSLSSVTSSTTNGSIPLLNTLLWKMVYSENWLDNHLTVKVERHQIWEKYFDDDDSYAYWPLSEVLPAVNFTKKWYIVKPAGKVFQGITQDIYVDSGLRNIYNRGVLPTTQAYGNMKAGFSSYFPFSKWISFKPSLGYGLTGQLSNLNSDSVYLEDRRKSYHYFYNTDSLYIGPSFLKAGIIYSLKLGINPPEPDPYFDNMFENKTFFNVTSDFAPYGAILIGSARDLRTYDWESSEEQHWDPILISGFFDYDFVNKNNIFLPKTSIPKNYFMGIGISESLTYDFKFNDFGANSLALYYQIGGYQFWFFDKVELIKAGTYWLHDFNNPHKNQIFLYLESKLKFAKNWGIELKLSTIGLNLGDSSNDYSALNDYFDNSMSSSSSPFYINELSATVEHDLHDWVVSLTYSLKQDWIKFGTQDLNRAGYYEHSVYITFNLKGLKGSGVPKSQLYNFNPREESRYGLD